jgi:hypothetical protein
MSAGSSAARRSSAAEEKARRLRAQADRLEAAAERQQKGASGERLLKAVLQPLTRRGYHLLEDRSVPGTVGNIDFIAIGPAGVLVVDAKNWSGSVGLARGELRQNGRARTEELDGILGQAGVVWQVLANAGAPSVSMWPVICLVGEAVLEAPALLGGVYVTSKFDVCNLIDQAPPTFDEAWTEWATAVLDSALPPRTAEQVGPATPPDEPVVYLTYWGKKPRYYLHDEDGVQGGFLDLVNGVPVGDSPIAEQVARQLLPHVAQGESGLGEADLKGLRRIIAALKGRPTPSGTQLVVGMSWTKYGRNRMYVSRLGSDGSWSQLGWYDFDDGRVYEAGPNEAIVRYCGQRYVATDEARRSHRRR